MKRTLTKYTLVILIVALYSCGSKEGNTQNVENNNGTVEHVTPNEFKAKMNEFKEYQLIDVRTPQEVASGKIDGAINIDFASSGFKEKIAQLDKTKPTLVYCAGGVRSAKAAKIMNEMGFKHIVDLKGGMGAWNQ